MTGKVKLVSAGGGSVSLATPSTGSNRTLTLPDADLTIPATNSSTTLTTQGDVLYRDGSGIQRLAKGTAKQCLAMNSAANAPEWSSNGIVQTTAWTAMGTGTTTAITGIPSTAYRLTVVMSDMSFGGSSEARVRLGHAGGGGTYITSGYQVTGSENGGSNTGAAKTDGYTSHGLANAGYALNGMLEIVKANSNVWNITGWYNAGNGTESTHFWLTGAVDVGAVVDRIQIDGSGGHSFDGGYWRVISTSLV